MAKVKDILDYFNTVAPFYMKFDFDNIGHLVGKLETEVKKVIVALDITDGVIDEAINLAIHHTINIRCLEIGTMVFYTTIIEYITSNL